jgi:hypothetical protein
MVNHPLSYQQQAMWFLTQTARAEEQCAFNLCYWMRVKGAIDPHPLRRAIDRLAGRHTILRTRIVLEEGHPSQCPSDVAVPLNVVDLAPGAEGEQRARDLATAEAGRALSVEEGPLAAFLLIRLGSVQSHVVMNIHHLISDGASIHILHRELAALYTQEALGTPAELPELDGECAQFAEVQRQSLESGGLADAQHFWQRELPADALPLELPLDFRRPSARSYRGAFHSVRLSPELMQACRAMSFRYRVPVSSLLLSGFAAILSRLTDQRRILIGTSFAGRRQRASHRHCVGMFINTVPLYFDLRAAAAWPDVIQIVNRAFTRAYDHQEYPLQLLIEERPTKRDWSRPALFQTAFNFQSARPEDFLWGESREMNWERVFSPTIVFDLVLHVTDFAGDVTARFDYGADVYCEERIVTLASLYVDSLQEMAAESAKGTPWLSPDARDCNPARILEEQPG